MMNDYNICIDTILEHIKPDLSFWEIVRDRAMLKLPYEVSSQILALMLSSRLIEKANEFNCYRLTGYGVEVLKNGGWLKELSRIRKKSSYDSIHKWGTALLTVFALFFGYLEYKQSMKSNTIKNSISDHEKRLQEIENKIDTQSSKDRLCH